MTQTSTTPETLPDTVPRIQIVLNGFSTEPKRILQTKTTVLLTPPSRTQKDIGFEYMSARTEIPIPVISTLSYTGRTMIAITKIGPLETGTSPSQTRYGITFGSTLSTVPLILTDDINIVHVQKLSK